MVNLAPVTAISGTAIYDLYYFFGTKCMTCVRDVGIHGKEGDDEHNNLI